MGKRKAIYVPFPQAVPNVPVIDREHCTYFIKTGALPDLREVLRAGGHPVRGAG